MGRDNLISPCLLAEVRGDEALIERLTGLIILQGGTWKRVKRAHSSNGTVTASFKACLPHDKWDTEIKQFSDEVHKLSPSLETRFSAYGLEDTDSSPESPVITLTENIQVIHEATGSTDHPSPNDANIIQIVIEAGWAFGTGTHPSTACAVMALEELKKQGILSEQSRVLDMGTGTGILAIAAALMGAGHVTAVDIDMEAIESAKRNCRLNGATDQVEVISADEWKKRREEERPNSKFDFCLANLTLSVAARLMAEMSAHLKQDGQIVLSGFKQGALCTARNLLISNSITEKNIFQRGNWCAILGIKQG